MEAAERDLILEPLSADEVSALAAEAGGVGALLSKKSPAYKRHQPLVQTEQDWIQAMAQEPRLIRRPVWQIGRRWLIGFQPDVWQAALDEEAADR